MRGMFDNGRFGYTSIIGINNVMGLDGSTSLFDVGDAFVGVYMILRS
jgi:hypothetical protein